MNHLLNKLTNLSSPFHQMNPCVQRSQLTKHCSDPSINNSFLMRFVSNWSFRYVVHHFNVADELRKTVIWWYIHRMKRCSSVAYWMFDSKASRDCWCDHTIRALAWSCFFLLHEVGLFLNSWRFYTEWFMFFGWI